MLIWLQVHVSYLKECEEQMLDSNFSVFSNIPRDFHKYLKPKPRNINLTEENARVLLNISEIQANIKKYNDMQYVHNEDIYGPLQNDSLIVVVQVSFFPFFFFPALGDLDYELNLNFL